MTFSGWSFVADRLREMAQTYRSGGATWSLDVGQCSSLEALAGRLPCHGVLIADEVGMGKTRIAVAVVRAVLDAGGRVVVLVPPGLGFQWEDELHSGGVDSPALLRSLVQFFQPWAADAEVPPWATQRVVLLSHRFASWRIGASTKSSHWSLLPQLYAGWRKHRDGAFPRHYHGHEKLADPLARAAAQSIVARAVEQGLAEAAFLDQLVQFAPWPGALDPAAYTKGRDLRVALERAVGLGLGAFDLVVIDEAHKSRGEETGLSRLLENVIVAQAGARKLAMTATPVELEAGQWKDALQRIGADTPVVTAAIESYGMAVRHVVEQPTQASRRQAFTAAARAFEQALAPYILRRDKRDSEAVQLFAKHTRLAPDAYRRGREIVIDPATLNPTWQAAICAAEALSVAAAKGVDPAAQRLRLTLGSGHGINRILDQVVLDPQTDALQLEADAQADGADTGPHDPKQAARVKFWIDVIRRALAGQGDALFEHPAIGAAVREIERADAAEEKVLVFGRFTRPMNALVELLNARRMLRSLRDGEPWPQRRVHEGEWPAVLAAQRQLRLFEGESQAQIDIQLSAQYKKLEALRETAREHLFAKLAPGLAELGPARAHARVLFRVFHETGAGLSSVTRALVESLGQDALKEPPVVWAQAFVQLVDAAADREDGVELRDESLDLINAQTLWATLAMRFDEEYQRAQGGFARLMYGKTQHTTRRFLQMAFNRANSAPRVLVVQSVVGREGLNLHKACRTVVLLHPEWNPAVVEQQIGRVDRLGSRWEQLLHEDVHAGRTPSARIEFLPIVFRGTYDEHNWQVLRRRWDELRAQLHGVVLHVPEDCGDPLLKALAKEINQTAPNFSPICLARRIGESTTVCRR